MTEPTDDNLIESLTAFADGELDAARSLAMWSYLAEHPDRHAALKWLRDQQQLTLAARRVTEAPAPSDLRARIAAMAARPQAASSVAPTRSWARRIGFPLAAAAGIAIGLTVATFFMRPTPVAEVLPARIVTSIARVHADCSRMPETTHDATFEATNATLATTVATSAGSASATPDLTSIGFRFVGAGRCMGLKSETVHLLYRAIDPKSPAAVSVFVQPDTGQFAQLESGRVFRVSSSTAPFPTLAWRHGPVIYFLLADDDKTEAAVLQMMHPTPPGEILQVASR
jgi:anti-sigma factor RsiW